MNTKKNEQGVLEVKTMQFANSERVYVCAPFGVKKQSKIFETVCAASEYAGYVMKEMQCFAIAIHTYLPFFIKDKSLMCYEQTMQIRMRVLDQCDVVMVCGERVNRGMKQEILYAVKQHKKIVVFNSEVFKIVMKIIRASGETEFDLRLDEKHPTLAKTPEIGTYDKFLKLCCG